MDYFLDDFTIKNLEKKRKITENNEKNIKNESDKSNIATVKPNNVNYSDTKSFLKNMRKNGVKKKKIDVVIYSGKDQIIESEEVMEESKKNDIIIENGCKIDEKTEKMDIENVFFNNIFKKCKIIYFSIKF